MKILINFCYILRFLVSNFFNEILLVQHFRWGWKKLQFCVVINLLLYEFKNWIGLFPLRLWNKRTFKFRSTRQETPKFRSIRPHISSIEFHKNVIKRQINMKVWNAINSSNSHRYFSQTESCSVPPNGQKNSITLFTNTRRVFQANKYHTNPFTNKIISNN